MKIHFVGIGKMGLPMAGHLLAAGHALSVHDPDPTRLGLAQAQGLARGDAAEGVRGADVVFSSLPHDGALLPVASLVAANAARGLTYVDASTVSPQASAQPAAVLAPAGVQYLRCTVSGNNKMAEAAQVTMMASGPRP